MTLGYFLDKRPLQKHSKLPKKSESKRLNVWRVLKMYYAIGASAPSLYIKSLLYHYVDFQGNDLLEYGELVIPMYIQKSVTPTPDYK